MTPQQRGVALTRRAQTKGCKMKIFILVIAREGCLDTAEVSKSETDLINNLGIENEDKEILRTEKYWNDDNGLEIAVYEREL